MVGQLLDGPRRVPFIARYEPIPRQSFPFGIPGHLAIIGRRQDFIRAVERGSADEGLRTEVVLAASRPNVSYRLAEQARVRNRGRVVESQNHG